MPKTSQAIVRNKGSAIFRMVFGLFFIGLGMARHFADGASPDAGIFTGAIGLLFFVYGLWALLAGNKVMIETPNTVATPTERLAEILKMKNDGLITEQEYEAKRQAILANL